MMVLGLMSGQYAIAADSSAIGEKCDTLPACAKVVSGLLGQKYIFTDDLRGKVDMSSNLELTKENAEVVFTTMLNMHGYSRVPIIQPNTFEIVRIRDARDSAIPLVNADAKTPPVLPDTWDLYTMRYKATNPEVIEEICRNLRSFTSANARMMPSELSGTVIITDNAPNLKKIYELIQGNDKKVPLEMKKKWERRAMMAEKRRDMEARQQRKEEKMEIIVNDSNQSPSRGKRPAKDQKGPEAPQPPSGN